MLVACSSSPTPEFTADTAVDHSVFLRSTTVTKDAFEAEIVGRNLEAFSGIAFRLQYDAHVLAFGSLSPGADWTDKRYVLAKEGKPGLLLVGIAEPGRPPTAPLEGERVLATVKFKRTSEDGSEISFDTVRSELRDTNGKTVRATFTGGKLQ